MRCYNTKGYKDGGPVKKKKGGDYKKPGFDNGTDNTRYYNAGDAYNQRNNPKNKLKDNAQNRKLHMEDAESRAEMADSNMRLGIAQRESENEQYTSPNHRPKENPGFKDGGPVKKKFPAALMSRGDTEVKEGKTTLSKADFGGKKKGKKPTKGKKYF